MRDLDTTRNVRCLFVNSKNKEWLNVELTSCDVSPYDTVLTGKLNHYAELPDLQKGSEISFSIDNVFSVS